MDITQPLKTMCPENGEGGGNMPAGCEVENQPKQDLKPDRQLIPVTPMYI